MTKSVLVMAQSKVFHSGDDPGCQSEPSWQDFVSMESRGGTLRRTVPTFDLEAELMDALHGPIVGIDEAGRGPWAGPVVVAAVILNPDRIPEGLNDFEGPHPEAREDRYAEIMATACVVRRHRPCPPHRPRQYLASDALGHARCVSRVAGARRHGDDRRQYRSAPLPLPTRGRSSAATAARSPSPRPPSSPRSRATG